MHKIIYGVREIPADQLPTVHDPASGKERTATDDELLQMGLHRIRDDVFSVAEQYHSAVVVIDGKPDRVWFHEHDTLPARDELDAAPRSAEEAATFRPGWLLGIGTPRERFEQIDGLPTRQRLLRADVVRAKNGNARSIVARSLTKQRRAVRDRPNALVEEAIRLAGDSASSVRRVRCTMDELDELTDIIVEANIVPHTWAGEL